MKFRFTASDVRLHRTSTFSAGHIVPTKESDIFWEGGREILTVESRATAPVGLVEFVYFQIRIVIDASLCTS